MKKMLLIFGLIYTVLITSVCNSVKETKDPKAADPAGTEIDSSRVATPDTPDHVLLQQTDSIPH